jgi:hypothetical protein
MLSNRLKKFFTWRIFNRSWFLREPQDIMSYAALAAIAIQSNQNDQHGGQSIPNFDYALSEGVKRHLKTNTQKIFIRHYIWF